MRRLPIVAVLLFGFAWAAWADDYEVKQVRAGQESKAKETIVFAGTTLVLAFQQDNQGNTIKEFVPEDETLERWTKLAALYEYPDLNDPQAVVDALAKRLEERNADVPYDIHNDAATGAVIIDFIIWPAEAASPEEAEYIEYNVFKYQAKPQGGLTAQQFALRQYEDIPGFLAKFRPQKDRLMKAMIADGLVMPSGKGQIVD